MDVYGFFSYATTAMPRGMVGDERKRVGEIVGSIINILNQRLEGPAGDALSAELESLSGGSQRFAALPMDQQALEINSIIDIYRAVNGGPDGQRMEAMRSLLTRTDLGVAGSEWGRSVLDIIFDRDGRIGREVEARSGGNRWSVQALNSYIGFSQEERNQTRDWLEHGGRLNDKLYNRVMDLISGEIRGEARAILVATGHDFCLRAAQAAADQDIQNLYDTNRHAQILNRALEGRG
jgi:hypothetical protein